MKGACPNTSICVSGMLGSVACCSPDGQPKIVDPGRRVVVEDLADGVKLDKIAAQRPSQEGSASKAEQHRDDAHNHSDHERHPRHGMRLTPSWHGTQPAPPLRPIADLPCRPIIHMDEIGLSRLPRYRRYGRVRSGGPMAILDHRPSVPADLRRRHFRGRLTPDPLRAGALPRFLHSDGARHVLASGTCVARVRDDPGCFARRYDPGSRHSCHLRLLADSAPAQYGLRGLDRGSAGDPGNGQPGHHHPFASVGQRRAFDARNYDLRFRDAPLRGFHCRLLRCICGLDHSAGRAGGLGNPDLAVDGGSEEALAVSGGLRRSLPLLRYCLGHPGCARTDAGTTSVE